MKIKIYEDESIVTYDFASKELLIKKLDEWKSDFRNANKTDQIIKSGGRDRYYERYCEQLDKYLKEYKENNG